jgi:CHAD domain-containing protein
MSNQLRDLDVYLLSEADYKAQLPDFLRDDLDPFFAYLHSQRKLALERVTAGLKSPEYARILRSWEAFLDEPPSADDTAVNAPLPIFTLARKRIYKRYRQIIKEGYHILEDDRDELLHELRIQCKKLRYLMEFFAGLFPAQKISRLIRQLKQLQGNLGDFNDYCVQEEYLIHVAEEMPMRNKQSRKALVALGVLVGDLHVKREAVKGEFAGTFQHFASPQNEALFVELFAPKKKGGKA